MSKSKDRFEAMREVTREKIHSAAVKLFSHKGLAATSVQEIADAAGISTGLMYRHYKSKEELFGTLVTEALEGLEQVGQLFESEMPSVDAIRTFTEEVLHDLSNGEEFLQYMMMFTQVFITNPASSWAKAVIERDRIVFWQIARLIERGQAQGQFQGGDPMQMAQYYFAAIQGISMMKFFMKDDFVPPTAQMMIAHIVKEGSKNDDTE